MCDIRVNKITVNVDKDYDEVKISLYHTNNLLGTLSDEDLDIPQFSQCGVSLKAYQLYIKDYIIELMDNGGIPGYYYEQKSDGQSIKYNASSFKNGVGEYIQSIIDDKYEYTLPMTERINITDRYKDMYINNATAEIDVRLTQFDVKFTVFAEIKSGQLCRPRVIKFGDKEYSFNVTNVGRIIKSAQ